MRSHRFERRRFWFLRDASTNFCFGLLMEFFTFALMSHGVVDGVALFSRDLAIDGGPVEAISMPEQRFERDTVSLLGYGLG